MVKLSELLSEITALETGMSKTASKKPASKVEQLASAIDKIAEELEKDKDKEEDKDHEKSESKDEEKKEDDEKKDWFEKKEGSVQLSNDAINKIAAAVIKKLEKIAVDSGPNTQGSVVNEGAKNDGAATSAARAEDQIISGDSVQSAANSNSEKNAPEGGDKTIEKSDINEVGDRPAPLGGMGAKAASVRYTAQEAETLQKLASVGYEYLVDYYSDKIVNEKIASAVLAEQAKDAPQKIAQAIVANQRAKTASAQQTPSVREKLAQISQNDPELFKALHVLSQRNLL